MTCDGSRAHRTVGSVMAPIESARANRPSPAGAGPALTSAAATPAASAYQKFQSVGSSVPQPSS